MESEVDAATLFTQPVFSGSQPQRRILPLDSPSLARICLALDFPSVTSRTAPFDQSCSPDQIMALVDFIAPPGLSSRPPNFSAGRLSSKLLQQYGALE
jgi:hypothetical protein